jgi:hypothetical protein
VRSALDLFACGRERDAALVLAAGIPTAWLAGEGVAVTALRTPYGRLGYALHERDGRLRPQLDAGATPPGGFVLTWPYGGAPGAAWIDGKAARWHGDELRIDAAPARVEVALPR